MNSGDKSNEGGGTKEKIGIQNTPNIMIHPVNYIQQVFSIKIL